MFNIVDDLVARMCLAATTSKYKTGCAYGFAGAVYSSNRVYKPGSSLEYRYENRSDMNLFIHHSPSLIECSDFITIEVPVSFNPIGHGFDLLQEISAVNAYRYGDLFITESSPGFMCVHKYFMTNLVHEIGKSLSDYSLYKWEHDHFVAVSDGTYYTHLLQSETAKDRPCSSDRIKLQASSEVTMYC